MGNKIINYDLYVHIHGEVEAESEDKWDVLDAVFPDGWDGEINEVYVRAPQFASDGYIEVVEDYDKENENDNEVEDDD